MNDNFVKTVKNLQESEEWFQALRKCEDSLSKIGDKSASTSSSVFSDLPLIQQSEFVVKGKITTKNQNVQEPNGQLFFDDGTGVMNCEVVSGQISLSCCNKDVVCTSWKRVFFSDRENSDSLEIEEVSTVKGTNAVKLTEISAVGVKVAEYLAKKKNVLGTFTVNVFGTITALSEIIRIKRDTLFLIQLSDDDTSISILIKAPKILHWQKFIQPKMSYVFENLLPTTLYKGETFEQKVFIPKSTSTLHLVGDVEIREINLEKWLSINVNDEDLKEELMSSYLKTSELLATDSCSAADLISYQGTITDASMLPKGFLILDGRVGLYLGFVPSVDKYKSLRIGTKIAVFNAHHKASTQAPKYHLYLCMLGCLKILEFSPFEMKNEVFDHQCCFHLHFLNMMNMSYIEVEWLQKVIEKLEEKLCPSIVKKKEMDGVAHCKQKGSKRVVEVSVLQKLLTSEFPGIKALFKPQGPRNLLLEFMTKNHSHCNVNSKVSKQMKLHFPSVENIQKFCEQEASQYDVLKCQLQNRPNPPVGEELNEMFYWNYRIIESREMEPSWVLVGVFKLCKKTGQLFFVDQTGKIPCVIAQSESKQLPHVCGSDCCYEAKDGFKCPYPQTGCLDYLVRLERFQIVIERFVISCFPSVNEVGESKYLESYRLHSYLQFSMQDVAPCWNLKGGNRKNVDRKRKGSSLESGHNKVVIIEKDVVKKNDKKYKSDFKCASNLLQEFSVSQLFVLTHKEAVHVKVKKGTKNILSFYALGIFIGSTAIIPSECTQSNDKSDICDSKSQNNNQQTHNCTQNQSNLADRRLVALNFEGASVKWHALLHVGCSYKLMQESCRDQNVFKKTVAHSGLNRALEKNDTRQCVMVTEDMKLVRVDSKETSDKPDDKIMVGKVTSQSDEQHIKNQSMPQILSVAELLNERNPNQLVSFKGIIQQRSYEKKSWCSGEDTSNTGFQTHISVPQNKSILFWIKDINSDADIKLYMDLTKHCYPLGLLDGAEVIFYKVECKLSRIKKPYCHFLVTSSLHIVKLPHKDFKKQIQSKTNYSEEDTLQIQLMNLYTLPWQHNLIIKCLCHIQQISRIELQAFCGECGKSYKHGRCDEMSCGSISKPVVHSKARFMIDDGTSNAVVYYNGKEVQKLLGLTPHQWQEIENLTGTFGTAEYDNFVERPPTYINALEKFLGLICTRTQASRRINLYAKFLQLQVKERRPINTVDEVPLSDFEKKVIKIGGESVDTYSLPMIQLQCVDIKPCNNMEILNKIFSEYPS